MLNFFYRFSRTSTAFRGKNIVCFFIRRLSMSTGLVIAGFFFRLGHCHEKNTHCSSCFEFFFFYCRHSKLMSTPSVSFRLYSVDTLYNFILSLQFPLQSRAVLQLKKKKKHQSCFCFFFNFSRAEESCSSQKLWGSFYGDLLQLRVAETQQ